MTRDEFMRHAKSEIELTLYGTKNRLMNLVQQAWAEGKRNSEMELITGILGEAVEMHTICERYGLTPKGVEYALEQYKTIICECTNGKLSKLTYSATKVMDEIEERYQELYAPNPPRVMTLEEVITHYSLPPVFVDDLSAQEDYLQDIAPLYFDFPQRDSRVVHWRGYQSVMKYIDDWKESYGMKWRCWTAKPTEEQMEATPWE